MTVVQNFQTLRIKHEVCRTIPLTHVSNDMSLKQYSCTLQEDSQTTGNDTKELTSWATIQIGTGWNTAVEYVDGDR